VVGPVLSPRAASGEATGRSLSGHGPSAGRPAGVAGERKVSLCDQDPAGGGRRLAGVARTTSRRLGESPQAFSSKLAEWQGDGDTEQRWRGRLQAVPLNVIADQDRTPVGMVSAVVEVEAAELISLWVSPGVRGAGVGDALIEPCFSGRWWWGWPGSRCGCGGHDHAVALYRRHGFVDDGPVETPVPGTGWSAG